MDSSPLAGDVGTIITTYAEEVATGLKMLRQLLDTPIYYCTGREELAPCEQLEGIDYCRFTGPHPAGLASTHIHFLDPVHENKRVWQLGYNELIAIGHLFQTGRLMTEKMIALCGAGILNPGLVRTKVGASLEQLLRRELSLDDLRIISGSVLAGREAIDSFAYIGRFDNQVSVIEDSTGRSIFNWLLPGKKRFSVRPVFAGSWVKNLQLPMNTALWGGKRAIYPLGTYDEVMPLDIIATSLLKAVVRCNTDKSKALGALELIEEDLGLCGYVCPGKNDFGEDLREVLTAIERGD
jgi:Na+-transporting NADH:ubiquinone oxidoreductase subunit A